MYKVDLHTHSVASPDGGLSAAHCRRMLASGRLDYIAVTDHNTIAFAQQLQAECGEQIIVGEEIATAEGELIGLYLHEAVPPGKSLLETARLIKKQGGLVYVPHPFETVRTGVSAAALETIAELVDIVETHNGRAVLQNRTAEAKAWAAAHGLPAAAASDAHGWRGWGRTYTEIAAKPTPASLPKLLRAARLQRRSPGPIGLLYPKMNRMRKVFRRA